MSRRFLRSAARATLIAVLAAALLPAVATPAVAAEADSSVTIPLPESWYGVEGGHLTVSKTRNLTDGESVGITALVPETPDSGAGRSGGYMQSATAYGANIFSVIDTPVAEGTKSAATAPAGWDAASRVDATVTVSSRFVTPTENASVFTSPGGVSVDCTVEQCFLALAPAPVIGPDGPFGVPSFPGREAIWVPISFEGGNAELVRDVPAVVTAPPSDASVDVGETATFGAEVAGYPVPTVRWQTSADDGGSWTDLDGATSTEVEVVATAADDGRLFRAVAANRQGEVASSAAALSVTTEAPSGVDDGRWALGQPGSWATVSQFSGLTDGQQITIEAEYTGLAAFDVWGADWAMPVAQAGFGWPNTRWEDGEWDPGAHQESKAEWVDAAALGDDRYRGSVEYTVHDVLHDPLSGQTFDCRVTQCYLYLGGGGRTAEHVSMSTITGREDWNEPSWENGEYSDKLSYLVWGGSTVTDHNNSVLVPISFEGGTLPAQTREAPVFTTQPSSATVEENNTAAFTVGVSGLPEATITWQRSVDAGRTWRTIGGAAGTTYAPFATPSLDGAQYRAVAENALGRTYSDVATLEVTTAGDTAGSGIVFEWSGSAELQVLSPARTPNYFSAGTSDGTKATYENVDGDAKTVFRRPNGSEQLTTYDLRGAHTSEGGQQIVRLSNGTADLDPSGAGTIAWDAAWTVNFYGGLVPFTFSDPELSIAEDGSGTLVADLTGYGADMTDPNVKVPLEPVDDVVVSTFSTVTFADGVLTAVPDYAGVEFDVPEGGEAVPQVREGAMWGAWPQPFVDFHFLTGLTSYWYSSGGTADPLKAPSPLTVSGIELPAASVPAAPAAPALSLGEAAAVTATWAPPSSDGGSGVTGYEVVLRSGEALVETRQVEGTAAEFADLEPGSTYSVTVAARNDIGLSAPSAASNTVTLPVDAAARPTAPPALLGDADFGADSGVPIEVSGSTITVRAGVDDAGTWIGVSVHSTATFVGWYRADASGTISAPLPTGLAAGVHHAAAYAADGAVLGYAAFTVAGSGLAVSGDPVVSPLATRLPATGAEAAALWPFAGAGILVLAAGAALVIRHRRVTRTR